MFSLFRTFCVAFVITISVYSIVKLFVDSMYLPLAIAIFSGIVFGLWSILNEKILKKGKQQGGKTWA